VWNPNASDSELIACLKDLIDAMATVTGSTLKWAPSRSEPHKNISPRVGSSFLLHRSSSSFLNMVWSSKVEASPALHVVCNCDEAMTDARVLQTEMAMRLGRLVTTDKPNLATPRLVAPRLVSSLSRRHSSNSKAYHNDVGEAGRAEAIAVLLSKRVLHEPAALVEIYQCALQGKVIVPICLVGRGYDYKKAGDHLGDLEAGLSARKLTELQQRLVALSSAGAPNDTVVSVTSLQAVLLATLPRIIAVNWEPAGGKNQLDATVTNLLARLLAQASTTKPQATHVKMGTLRAAVRLVKAAEATQAGSTRLSKRVEVEV